MRADGMTAEEIRRTAVTRAFGIRDGNGIMFVSSTGDVCPAGFLPLPTGNVRRDDVVQLYREAPLFRALRDPHRFHGRCGRCEYGAMCGGSRARAYVVTGDPLESDPFCPYEPRGHGTHGH
jgi:radical SAM protein with 4Fe4S-binding SPASM domain